MHEKLKFILFLNIKISSKVKFISFISNCSLFIIILALINDWSSAVPPDIYSFTPFIYNLTLRADQLELLIPSNQGNWIDCSKDNDRQLAENSKEIPINSIVKNGFLFFKIMYHYVLNHLY
jgi:hypothetical protein